MRAIPAVLTMARISFRQRVLAFEGNRGPKDHMNARILHPGSKAQDKADCRNHGLWDPSVHAG